MPRAFLFQGTGLEAERKMGQMLQETERAKGDLKRGPVVTTRNHGDTPTLAALGLSKRESAEAQMLAELPAEDFEKVRTGKKTANSTSAVSKSPLPFGVYRSGPRTIDPSGERGLHLVSIAFRRLPLWSLGKKQLIAQNA